MIKSTRSKAVNEDDKDDTTGEEQSAGMLHYSHHGHKHRCVQALKSSPPWLSFIS